MSRAEHEPSRLERPAGRRLSAQTLTYDQVRATLEALPDDWDPFERTEPVGLGRTDFERAARAVLGWRLQLRAGISVAASKPRVEVDTVAVLRPGVGPSVWSRRSASYG